MYQTQDLAWPLTGIMSTITRHLSDSSQDEIRLLHALRGLCEVDGWLRDVHDPTLNSGWELYNRARTLYRSRHEQNMTWGIVRLNDPLAFDSCGLGSAFPRELGLGMAEMVFGCLSLPFDRLGRLRFIQSGEYVYAAGNLAPSTEPAQSVWLVHSLWPNERIWLVPLAGCEIECEPQWQPIREGLRAAKMQNKDRPANARLPVFDSESRTWTTLPEMTLPKIESTDIQACLALTGHTHPLVQHPTANLYLED